MNLLEKIIFFFYNLAIAVLSILFIVISLRLLPLDTIGFYFHTMYYSGLQGQLNNLLIGLIFFFVSLRFIFITFQKNSKARSSAITYSTEIGDVKISVEAIETMATRTGRQIPGVRDLVAKVVPTEFGAKIALKVSLDPETSIPETTDMLQEEVKKYVERLSGIKIEKVIVVVKDVLQKPAVQKAPLK